jgi:hypothetical protein
MVVAPLCESLRRCLCDVAWAMPPRSASTALPKLEIGVPETFVDGKLF